HIRRLLPELRLTELEDRALIALQGPGAAAVLSRNWPKLAAMPFMTLAEEGSLLISRSGYTGEDGYEISLPVDAAEAFVRALLKNDEVKLIGLGARDSLRLEAGLCLYGHDIDETVNAAEANLMWSIQKRRKTDRDFPAADKILDAKPSKKRVGIRAEGRAPAREGAEIADKDGRVIGRIT